MEWGGLVWCGVEWSGWNYGAKGERISDYSTNHQFAIKFMSITCPEGCSKLIGSMKKTFDHFG